MKNKLKKTMTALCAALILMGGFSVPAYAQGAATEPPAGDATNDSNVVVEEKEETPPLTPKGNATLCLLYTSKELVAGLTEPQRANVSPYIPCGKHGRHEAETGK